MPSSHAPARTKLQAADCTALGARVQARRPACVDRRLRHQADGPSQWSPPAARYEVDLHRGLICPESLDGALKEQG